MTDDQKDGKKTVDEEQTLLLQKMIERQERDIRLSRITAIAECALLTALIIVFALLVPKFLTTVTRVQEAMEEVDVLVEHAEESMSEITDLVRDADSIIMSNEEAISEAIENFNSVDFESLNQSISELAQIMEPVVEVVRILRE